MPRRSTRENYFLDHEIEKDIEKKASYKRKINEYAQETADRGIAEPIIVNGIQYESLTKAGLAIGVSHKTMSKHYAKLRKSSLSEMDFEIMVVKKFTFKKVIKK